MALAGLQERVTENGRKLHLDTIWSMIRRFALRACFKSKKRSGRPKEISDDDKN
jgi:hypothetical protein